VTSFLSSSMTRTKMLVRVTRALWTSGTRAALSFAIMLLVAGCVGDAPEPEERTADGAPSTSFTGPVMEQLRARGWAHAQEGSEAPARPMVHETEEDWAVARATLEWAWSQDLDLLPVGEVAAILGATFVGAPYVPGTLEVPGPEGLVVNLTEFDCVTFVEHILVLARLTVEAGAELLDDEEVFRNRYRGALTGLRYRGGILDGYPSRLHYFSEWLGDAEAKGWVRRVTADLGGIRDQRPIHFMSSNPHAYRQLAEDPSLVQAVRRTEERISAEPRYFIPEDRIAAVAREIRNGDVIGAVSTVDGLDIAHTGIAFWHGDRLHLLHAPLVGESVEISARPLAERIQRIGSQKGIMVARPLDARDRTAGERP
jgi:hypothetical protein